MVSSQESRVWSFATCYLLLYPLYCKSLATQFVLLNFHHHLSCWITSLCQCTAIFKLQLCFHLFCMSSGICCICLSHFQKKCKLLIWPPLCPPNIWESNVIVLSIVWIIYSMLCLVVAWYWFWIFELDPQPWSIPICNITKSVMIFNSG